MCDVRHRSTRGLVDDTDADADDESLAVLRVPSLRDAVI